MRWRPGPTLLKHTAALSPQALASSLFAVSFHFKWHISHHFAAKVPAATAAFILNADSIKT
jgi:hypothetical protein